MVLFTRAGTTKRRSPGAGGSAPAYLIAILQWMAPEIGPGVVLIGAVFGFMWTPFSVAVRRLMRPPVSAPRALAALVVVPSAWLIPEWIRSYQGLGGPWGLYGASQWQHPAVLALAAIGGAWLVSVALLLANAGLLLILGALRPDLLTGAPRPATTRTARDATGRPDDAAAGSGSRRWARSRSWPPPDRARSRSP